MDQVCNELSLSASLPDRYAVQTALRHMSKASKALCDLGCAPAIRVTRDFADRLLSPDLSVRAYLGLKTTGEERTVQSFLRSRFLKAPYVEELSEQEGITDLEEYCTTDEETCKGLALAVLWNIPALSLGGDARFVPPAVTITHRSLSDASQADLLQEKILVDIICKEEDVASHSARLKDTLLSPLQDGPSVLAHREMLPFLTFSKHAEEQLRVCRSGGVFPRIRDILVEINRAMQEAVEHTRGFSSQKFKYTPTESDSATQGIKGQKHTFTFMEAGSSHTVLCTAHMRITRGDRVYFCPNVPEKKAYIGYIGKHLPTKNYT